MALFITAVMVLLVWESADSHHQAVRRADALAAEYARNLAARLSKGPLRNDQLTSNNGIVGLAVINAAQSRGQAEVQIQVTGDDSGPITGSVVNRCYDVKVNGIGRPNPQHVLTPLKACPPPPTPPTPVESLAA